MYLLYCVSVAVAEDQPTVGDKGAPGGSVKSSDAAVAIEPPTAVASAGLVTTPQGVTTVGALTTFQ